MYDRALICKECPVFHTVKNTNSSEHFTSIFLLRICPLMAKTDALDVHPKLQGHTDKQLLQDYVIQHSKRSMIKIIYIIELQ
ncbi:hypothetical protein FKM82_008936 [Ascaphus truei]